MAQPWENDPIVPAAPAAQEAPWTSDPIISAAPGKQVQGYPIVSEAPAAAGRIGNAIVSGYQNTPPLLTPEARAQLESTIGGKYIVSPINQLLGVGAGVVGAIGGGLGQAAYDAGNAIGGPAMGRDVYMGAQVAPVASMGAGMPRVEAPAVEAPRPQFVSERMAPPPVEGQGTLGRINQLLQHDNAEVAGQGPQPPAVSPASAPAAIEPPPLALVPKSSAEAKQIAGTFYDQADKAGGTLTPQFTDKFIDGVTANAPQTEAGQAVAGQSPVTNLVDRLQSLKGKPMTLQAAQEVDEALGNLIDKEYGVKGMSKDGRKLAGIQSDFRDQIENAGPGDITGGTSGFDALGPARQAWSQAMKMDDLERIQARAELTDNPATSVRTQIRSLLNNPARVRGYSPEEIAALRTAAARGALGGLLHVFGSRLVPIMAVGAEAGTHGLTAGLAAGGVAHFGTAALRNLATRNASSRLNNVMEVLGRGVPQNALLPPP